MYDRIYTYESAICDRFKTPVYTFMSWCRSLILQLPHYVLSTNYMHATINYI